MWAHSGAALLTPFLPVCLLLAGFRQVEMATWYFDYVSFNHSGLVRKAFSAPPSPPSPLPGPRETDRKHGARAADLPLTSPTLSPCSPPPQRPYYNTLWAVLIGAGRKAISRVLLLVVGMGYGVVRGGQSF